MEKGIAILAYWLGLGSTAIAFISRVLAIGGIWPASHVAATGKIPLSYWSFFDGAVLMFMIAIASSVISLARADKA